MRCGGKSRVLCYFFFSGFFNLWYIWVNVGIDVNVFFYEVFNFNFLEFVFINDSSYSNFLLEMGEEGVRERENLKI